MTSAIFTVEDNVAPTITVEALPQTVECDGTGNIAEYQGWLASFAGAVATDDCGDVTWSYVDAPFSDDCGATGFVSVDFIATDDCGNTSITTADFIIEDTTDPSISNVAMDETVECDGSGNTAQLNDWLNANGNAVANDDCGTMSWSYTLGMNTTSCGLGSSQEVIFMVTDECGNSNTTTANFIIEDTTPPSIDTPSSNTIVECDGSGNTSELNTWINNNGGAIATDDCGAITWTFTDDGFTSTCGLSGERTITFIATDDCDNSSETTAVFIIQDTTSTHQLVVRISLSLIRHLLALLMYQKVLMWNVTLFHHWSYLT